MASSAASQHSPRAFRLLTDKALATCSLDTRDDVEAHYGPAFATVQPADYWSVLQKVMKNAVCIPRSGESVSSMLRRTRREVIYESALGHPADPYAPLLRRLADACREGSARAFEDEAPWLEAIHAAQAMGVLNGDLPDRNPREPMVRDAARRLIATGATLRVENGRFAMDDDEFRRLAQMLDDQVAALGGLPTIEQVLAYLTAVEPLNFGRYAPGRSFGHDRHMPSFPVGYLLQLGVKHLKSPPAIAARRPELWADVASRARDLCAVLDTEPYVNMENIFLDAHDLPNYLSSAALFDHLFALKQWPPSRAGDLLRGVTIKLDSVEVRSRVGWDMADVLALMEAVLKVAQGPVTILTPQDLQRAGLSPITWEALRGDFVHPLGEVNPGYVAPLDADQAEFDFKPLFALPRNHLLVVTPGLACLAFYEAATRRLRAARYPNLDGLLGEAVEAVTAAALRSSGLNVTVQGQEYFVSGGAKGEATGECDIVVETEKSIVFIELKKKPLRRISSTGDAAPGLVDLSASLFAAQSQLARHEQNLLRDGRISFANGYVLELSDRQIDRIAMTWLDYGGLQDKVLLDQVFTALVNHRVTTDHPKEEKGLKDLNDAIDILEMEIEEARRLGKVEHALFINCWFLSVPQLTMFLDGISTPAQFEKRLGTLRHMSYRTLDFYRDFGFARQGHLL